MKITLNWLRQYVPFEGSPSELAERLTMLGLEVEGIETVGNEFEGVVVAEVVTREKHPNADKLSVCRVRDGAGERQIVCGAQNFKPGDKVPLILPGHSLPLRAGETQPFTIKVGKIRGVESHGMLCAADELGIDPVAIGLRREEGLLVLDPSARVGQPFREYLGMGGPDVVFDLEVTPNRPDLNSVIGIAREIAAVTGARLQLPEVNLPAAAPGTPSAADLVAVRLDAPDLCPRYTARVIRGVRIGPSPAWLRETLEKVGLRSINNVVDVTNYVMLETGQPLHAFDYHLVARGNEDRPTVVVRRAADGETFVTLDGREHRLAPDHLLIADPEKGIALAGVMGGQNTEVSDRTADILLESAYFLPTSVRRTSKALGLRTDASYRFERGADPAGAEHASARAAALILETAGGTLAGGVVDAWPEPFQPRQITLRPGKANALLGLSLRPEEMDYYLGQLGLRPAARPPRPVDAEPAPVTLSYRIPSWRVDLKREIDLVEEIARLHGVDRIPSSAPRQARGAHAFDTLHDELSAARQLLAGLGLHEVQGQTLVSSANLRSVPPAEVVRLANPLSSDMDVLRPSLLPGLLDILRHNQRHQNADLALFEIGRVFRSAGNGVREHWRLALALCGRRREPFWADARREDVTDIHDLKGILEEFLARFGVRGIGFQRAESSDLYVESARILLGGRRAMGEIGQLHPRIARQNDLRQAVFMAELDLDEMLARRNAGRSFQSLPAFPAVRRDVAMIVAEGVEHDAVLKAVRAAGARHLDAVRLFDVFRGTGVPEGHKSVAYAFIYRASDRTLTDAEVNTEHQKIVTKLLGDLGATIRQG